MVAVARCTGMPARYVNIVSPGPPHTYAQHHTYAWTNVETCFNDVDYGGTPYPGWKGKRDAIEGEIFF